jgi:hypothetical protein
VHYGYWWKYVSEFLKYKKQIHIVHYEEYYRNPKQTLLKLCEYLGKNLSESQLDQIIKACSFETMRKDPMANREDMKNAGVFKNDGNWEDGTGFIRKGEVGDWLNYFDFNMSKKFDEAIKKNLTDKEIKFDFGVSDEEADAFLKLKESKSIQRI